MAVLTPLSALERAVLVALSYYMRGEDKDGRFLRSHLDQVLNDIALDWPAQVNTALIIAHYQKEHDV